MNFPFFKKKTILTPDLSCLSVDMHSHLLPGIDDGLKTPEETVAFMSDLHQLGYKKFICTPHVLSGVHNNTPESILAALAIAQKAVSDARIPITIEASAEYMVDQDFGTYLKNDGQLLPIAGKYILIEMSYVSYSPNLNEVIFDLQIKNYLPILAHPERYNYFHKKFSAYEDIKDRNVLFQVNLLSLAGYYGKDVQRVANKLVEANMVDFIGTDMHHTNHLNAMQGFVRSKDFYDIVDKLALKNKELL